MDLLLPPSRRRGRGAGWPAPVACSSRASVQRPTTGSAHSGRAERTASRRIGLNRAPRSSARPGARRLRRRRAGGRSRLYHREFLPRHADMPFERATRSCRRLRSNISCDVMCLARAASRISSRKPRSPGGGTRPVPAGGTGSRGTGSAVVPAPLTGGSGVLTRRRQVGAGGTRIGYHLIGAFDAPSRGPPEPSRGCLRAP